jgi:hypothetical protein
LTATESWIENWFTGKRGFAREGQWMSDATTSVVKQEIRVQAIEETQEMSVCVELQRRIWGYAPIDTVPDQIFIVAKKTEWAGDDGVRRRDAGRICFWRSPLCARGLPTDIRTWWRSRTSIRTAGWGRMLKLAQRENALDRGINLMEWTFDPLQFKNAALQDRATRRHRAALDTQSSRAQSSPLQAGLPTDRFVAERWVRSQQVKAVLPAGRH